MKALEGLDVEEARRRVEGRGLQFRVLARDGISFPAPADYRTDRVGVDVTAGKVTAARIG